MSLSPGESANSEFQASTPSFTDVCIQALPELLLLDPQGSPLRSRPLPPEHPYFAGKRVNIAVTNFGELGLSDPTVLGLGSWSVLVEDAMSAELTAVPDMIAHGGAYSSDRVRQLTFKATIRGEDDTWHFATTEENEQLASVLSLLTPDHVDHTPPPRPGRGLHHPVLKGVLSHIQTRRVSKLQSPNRIINSW
jgi:hypothetical protein